MAGRSNPIKVRTRRATAREWSVLEREALHLWTRTWGGKLIALPQSDCFDAFWTNGKVVVGALEVKMHLPTPGAAVATEVLSVPVVKWSMAVWLESYRIGTYVIFCTPENVLWQHALEVDRFAVWAPRETLPDVHGAPHPPEVVASYLVSRMHLLDNQPLFSERSPGGTGYAVPS